MQEGKRLFLYAPWRLRKPRRGPPLPLHPPLGTAEQSAQLQCGRNPQWAQVPVLPLPPIPHPCPLLLPILAQLLVPLLPRDSATEILSVLPFLHSMCIAFKEVTRRNHCRTSGIAVDWRADGVKVGRKGRWGRGRGRGAAPVGEG